MKTFLRLGCCFVAALALGGCSSDEEQGERSLLVAEGDGSDVEGELLRLKQMQTLRLASSVNGEPLEVELPRVRGSADTAVHEEHNLNALLGHMRIGLGAGGNEPDLGGCSVAIDESLIDGLRDVISLVALANAEGTVEIGPSSWMDADANLILGEYVIPPQANAVRAGLAELALRRVKDELTYFEERVLDCGADSVGYPRVLAELSRLRVEAGELLAKLSTTVADSQFGSAVSGDVEFSRAFQGPQLSRAAAAHAFVSGGEGDDYEDALGCNAPDLTEESRSLVDLFRLAGASPSLFLSASDEIESGSEGAAVAALVDAGDDSLAVRIPLAFGHASAAVQALNQFRRDDILSAILYLANEIRVYERDQSTLVSDDTFEFARYAAVATEPQRLPASYWVAKIRDSSNFGPQSELGQVFGNLWTISDFYGPGEFHEPYAQDHLVLAERRMASLLLQGYTQKGGRDTLARLASNTESLGVLTVCSDFQGAPEYSEYFALKLFEQDSSAQQNYFLVSGAAGLSCAVAGNVEGQDCDLDDYLFLGNNDSNGFSFDAIQTGDTYYEPFRTLLGSAGRSPDGLMFLVRRRGGAGGAIPAPGQLESLLGYTHERSVSWGVEVVEGDRNCVHYPVAPKYEQRAAELIRPNRENCFRPQISCAEGEYWDARLPLENELSDDGDAFESSWKYYLEQAKLAATESDSLGKEYIDVALGESLRKESEDRIARAREENAAQELQKLQEICGTSVDVASLLAALGIDESGSLDYSKTETETDCADSDQLPAGTRCMDGKVHNLWQGIVASSENPELVKLGECIEAFTSTTPLSQLGKRGLCYTDGQENMCASAHAAGIRCPQPVDDGACPAPVELESGMGQASWSQITAEDGLQWFEISDHLPDTPDEGICVSARKLRSGYGNAKDHISALKGQSIYQKGALDQLRDRLEFRAKFGGYVDVLKDGEVWLTTGDVATGAAVGRVLCGGDVTPDCSNGEIDGLFCSEKNCENLYERTLLNERLLNAGKALSLITQDGTKGVRFALPARFPRGVYPRGSSARNHLVGGTTTVHEKSNSAVRTYDTFDTLEEPSTFGCSDTGHVAYSYTTGEGALSCIPIYGESDGESHGKYDYHFGTWSFTGPRTASNWYAGFWGSLSTNRNNEGYFYRRFTESGVSHRALVQGTVERSATAAQISFGAERNMHSFDFCDRYDDGRTLGKENKGDREYLKEQMAASQLWADYNGDGSDYSVEGNEAFLREFCEGPAFETYDFVDGFDFYNDELAFLDAFELICEAQLPTKANPYASNCEEPPVVNSVDDLGHLADFLECRGAELNYQASSLVLRDFPTAVLRELRAGSTARPVEGEMGVAVSQLRSALKQIANSGDDWQRLSDGFALTMRRIQSEARALGLQNELSAIEFNSVETQNITNCLNGMLDTLNGTFFTAAVRGAQGAVTCVNSRMQNAFARQRLVAETEINAEALTQIFIAADAEFVLLQGQFADQAEALGEAQEQIQRSLATIEQLRDEARRSLDMAMWHLEAQSDETGLIMAVFDRKTIAASESYRRAHGNAVRWAFLARRAIEQRLGVELESMADELPLVEAPSTWVHSVCNTSPIDYGSLESQSEDYSDRFIGNYVKNLENVVESYRLTQSFQEGSDLAVVSMRDDLLNVREECLVPSYNLLPSSGALLSGDGTSWVVRGCEEEEQLGAAGGAPINENHCLSIERAISSPFGAPFDRNRTVSGYELTFGQRTCENGSCISECEANECTWTEDARLTQEIELSPGSYRFSWSEHRDDPQLLTDGYTTMGSVWLNGVEVVSRSATESLRGIPAQDRSVEWDRFWVTFDLDETSTVEVGFSGGEAPNHGLVGAPMLEAIRYNDFAAEDPPAGFVNTNAERQHWAPECEDRDGDLFRAQWTRGCEDLCADGFSPTCGGQAQTLCYREATFYVSNDLIDMGRGLVQAGFAKGNFNYRVENLSLNFVGTGLRNCAEQGLSSTCYTAGYIPYSIYHSGPFRVKNHIGELFNAKLFDGRIEQARGLALERYFSNPIASTDLGLLEQYRRHEFKGRPLDGRFTVRVWEEPGVEFDNLEDVQVLLKYRYWTRQQ